MMHTETSKKLLNRNTEVKMANGRCRHSICPEARQEVAREIFAEIEKWLAYDGDIRMITDEKFAGIKKKYTEGET